MRKFLASSLILTAICISIFVIPQASALPVSYNQTALNFGLTSVPRNSSSYDVFTLNQDNWLWAKFDNNTVDSSPLSVNSTITYNTNLKLLLKFENSLVDSTTNAHNAAVATGSAVYGSGQEGQAFSFNGATGLSGSDTSLPNGNNAWSVSFWINPTVANPFIASWGSVGAGNDVEFSVVSNKLNVGTYGTGNLLVSTNSISTSTWTHIVVTFDGTTIRSYFNGVQDATTAAHTYAIVRNAYHIGSFYELSGFLTGKIDEFRVYSVALNSGQVKALDMVGKYSQSHTFDTGEYITYPDSTTPIGNSPWTVSGWIKPTNGTTSMGVFGWGSNVNNQAIQILLSSADKLIVDNVAGIVYTSTTAVSTNTYTYVAVTYDGTTIKSYFNGLQDATTATPAAFNITPSGSTGLKIGNKPALGLTFTGQLDNMKLYPYALTSSQINTDQSLALVSSGKQYMSWYNSISGSSTLTKKIGGGQASITTACALNNINPVIIANLTNIYYVCTATNLVKQVPISTGTSTTYFAMQTPSGVNNKYLFSTMQKIMTISSSGSGAASVQSTRTSNTTLGITPSSFQVTNQKISSSTSGLKYNMNTTTLQTVSTNACEINYSPTNTTKLLDSIACDQSVPAMTVRYWNGFMIQKVANYNTNSTQTFLNSIDASSYKKLLSLPCLILVNETPCITFIATDFSNTDYLVILTSTHVYYGNAQTALTLLQNHNYALQSYDIITTSTTSAYEIQNPILQGITLYGFNLNTTLNKAGLFTLPSGYTTKTTTINSAIRTIDPRWSDDVTDMPIITTSSSLFPIFLTASNSPSFAAIKVTSATQILNGQEAVYALAQLDSTRSVEFDLIAGTCANVYIADISVSPSIWNFQGIICATGVNQKTIAYTNTVPYTFFTLKYGVTDSYTPSNNGLTTTFRTSSAPTTYTVIVRNSTGTIAINQTFTIPANQTIDTRSFNVSSVTKPAALSVTVGGLEVYSAYLGSALSLASMSSFFHQYLNYQGFDLLSFIPIVFASMFTRNTVGVGMALTVVLIATLSWLSIVVVPEPVVYVSIIISVIAMVGYRAYGYL